MKTKTWFWFGLMVSLAGAAWAQPAAAPATAANLALVATPSSSYVSGDTTLAALNDGYQPRSSRDVRRKSYGNWPKTGTQWVQYDWSQPISTGRIEVYWWADGQGVHAPEACRLLYWNGKAFVPVGNPTGLGVTENQFNATTFDEVQTDKLRLELDGAGSFSTGILEWRVYDSGKSPKFPPTVAAGIDRVVVLGGKTWLNGRMKSIYSTNTPQAAVLWSKASGPGKVDFENPHVPATTAKFSEAGDYVLELQAREGRLNATSRLQVKVEPPPPATALEPVYTKNYKVNSPLWNSRIKALIVNWIPHCIDMINRTNLTQGQGGIDNFIEAAKALAGQPHEPQKGYVFANAWVHQTVEAMSLALMVDPQGDADIIQAQEKMKATLADWIPKILAAQEPDGYLQTAWTLRNPNRWHERWSPEGRGNHEGYTGGYFLESTINYQIMTKGQDPRLYNAAKKLADCWYDNIGPAPKKEWYDGHEEMEQALVRFGHFVNDQEGGGKGDKYIQLARFLLDCRKNGGEYDQSHVPVVQQYEAVGHAVRAVYCYSGIANIAIATHDADYESAAFSLCDNLVNKKYYVTGGVGSGETSEGFGGNYSLRNNAYCESCSSCGEIFFQHKLNLESQDAHYADLYEETMYNALLGSLDLDGKNFYYDNPLDATVARYPWHACPCCVGNIPRTLLMLPTWMYARGQDSLYVNLFIGSTVTVENIAGTDVQMVQETDYPWSGEVSITVNPAEAKSFTIKIRAPNRQASDLYVGTPAVSGITSLSVNGSKLKPKLDKGYATITRTWKAGDKIALTLPMTVQRVKPSEKISADKGRVALRYGPLIYNLESVDQDITQALDPRSALTTEWKGDLLDGVRVVKGSFVGGGEMTAIPNYARCNRMTKTGESGLRNDRGREISSIVWMKAE